MKTEPVFMVAIVDRKYPSVERYRLVGVNEVKRRWGTGSMIYSAAQILSNPGLVVPSAIDLRYEPDYTITITLIGHEQVPFPDNVGKE